MKWLSNRLEAKNLHVAPSESFKMWPYIEIMAGLDFKDS